MMKNRIHNIQLILILFGSFHLFGQPDWTVNTADYILDAEIVASLVISDEVSLDAADMVAAFDAEGNVRGVASLSFFNFTNTYVAYLTVVSSSYGDALTFKIYDASEDAIYLSGNAPIVFESNLSLGSPFSPYVVVSSIEVVGIEESKIEGFSFYPNPVKDVLYLKSISEKLESIFIYNALGKLVLSKEIEGFYMEVGLSQLPKGTYFIKVISGAVFEVIPLLKN